MLFWAAFILTRPLGATFGDLLDKPVDHGGFAFSRYSASGILAALIVACILFLPQKAGNHPDKLKKLPEPGKARMQPPPNGQPAHKKLGWNEDAVVILVII